jgi:hypothetical protein
MSGPITGASLSLNPLQPLTVTQPPATSLPASTGQAAAPETNTAPIAPPIVAQPARALIQLTDGTTLTVTDADLPVDPNLKTDERIQLRYSRLQQLVSDNQGKIRELSISDPELLAMYQLDKIITGPLDDSFIKKLDRAVKQLLQGETRAYLKFIIAQVLFNNNRITPAELRLRLEDVIKQGVADIRFFEFYAQQYVKEGESRLAAVTFARYLQLRTGVTGPEPDLEVLAAKLIAKVNDGQLLNQFGDYLLLWGKNQTDWRRQEQLVPLAEQCYRKALTVDQSPAAQVISRVKLGDVDLMLAVIAVQKEDEENQKAQINAAIELYQAAIDLAPDNYPFRVKLADALTLRGQLNASEPDLKRAKLEYLKAFESDPGSVDILIRLVAVLSQLDEADKAFDLIDRVIAQVPANPLLYTVLGDLQAANGKFDEAVASYEKAFALALQSQEAGVAYADVYTRFNNLRLSLDLRLAQLQARFSPNPLRLLIRLIGDLMYFANPINLIVFAVKNKDPKYTNEQLEQFVSSLPRLNDKVISRYRAGSRDVNFYLANLLEFNRLDKTVTEQLEASKKGLVEKEVVDELLQLQAEYRSEIDRNLGRLSLESEWETAKSKKDPKAALALFQATLQAYMSTAAFLNKADLSGKTREKLVEAQEQSWKLAESIFDELIDLAEDQNDLASAVAVWQLVAQSGGMLENISLGQKEPKTNFTPQLEKIGSYFRTALETVIEIAQEKKDYTTLLELAKDQAHIGNFARAALEAALETATDEKNAAQLEAAANFAFKMAREEPSVGHGEREKYLIVATEAYAELIDLLPPGEGDAARARVAIKLWRLGKYEEAIGLFEGNLSRATDKLQRFNLMIDLAYMSLAREDKDQARYYLKELLKVLPGNADLKKELEYLDNPNIMPAEIILESSPYFSHAALRATTILYSNWLEGDQAAAIDQGIVDLYEASGRKVKIRREVTPTGKAVLYFDEPQVTGIAIKRRENASILPIKTRDEAILRELSYFGIKPGDTYDEARVEEAIKIARMRLKTFDLIDWRISADGRSLEIEIMEKQPVYLRAGGGGGTMDARLFLEGGVSNLLGGGETLGGGIAYHWFYGEGFKSFSLLEGSLYYRDPHLFRLGEDHPVSFGINAERYGMRDYETGGRETMNGGSVSLGVQLSKYVGLHFTPSLHYMENDSAPNYFRNGFRISLDYDDRDDWLLPSSGQIFSVYVQPGVYYGGSPAAGFLKAGVSAEKYFALPADFVVMIGAKADIGYNLLGTDLFALGANGYVRGAKDFSAAGPMISAGSVELRSPVWNIGDYGEYAKIQPYLFADAGAIFGYSGRPTLGWGVGGGIRFGIPFLGLINIYYGFPAGIGFSVGSVTPNY